MKTQDNQYTIYIRSTRERIPVSKQEFDDYYRGINAFRRTQQNHSRCVCPRSKWLQCDMDCFNCPYHTSGDLSSLDDNLTDADGNEMPWLDRLQTEMPDLQTASPEEIVADKSEMTAILSRLKELMPQAIEIGTLRLQGLSEDAIAERIGTGRKTYAYRIKKVTEILKAEFPEFF